MAAAKPFCAFTWSPSDRKVKYPQDLRPLRRNFAAVATQSPRWRHNRRAPV